MLLTENHRKPPDSKASSVTRRTPSPSEPPGGSGTHSPMSNAEAEVVNELMISSCSITEDDAPAPETAEKTEACATDDERDSLFDGPMDIDVDADVEIVEPNREQQSPPAVSGDPLNDGGSHTASEGPATMEPDIMDVDGPAEADQSMDPLDLLAHDSPPPTAPSTSKAVAPVNFYGSSAKSRGKRKAESPPLDTFPPQNAFPPEADEDDADDVVVVGGQPSCVVYLKFALRRGLTSSAA